jgi:hypothetical protein
MSHVEFNVLIQFFNYLTALGFLAYLWFWYSIPWVVTIILIVRLTMRGKK